MCLSKSYLWSNTHACRLSFLHFPNNEHAVFMWISKVNGQPQEGGEWCQEKQTLNCFFSHFLSCWYFHSLRTKTPYHITNFNYQIYWNISKLTLFHLTYLPSSTSSVPSSSTHFIQSDEKVLDLCGSFSLIMQIVLTCPYMYQGAPLNSSTLNSALLKVPRTAGSEMHVLGAHLHS